MLTNLDIWAIQYYPECLKTALDNIKEGSKVFLLRNCMSHFLIGEDQITSRQFDTVLYSDDSDLLIMIMRNGKEKDSEIVEYLENKKIPYFEKDLGVKTEDYKDGDNIPEVWFVREEYVLKDALEESKSRKIEVAQFYKNAKSILSLCDSKDKELLTIQGRGIVKLKDKIAIIINHGIEKNMSTEDVIKCINENGIKCEEKEESTPNIRVENFSEKIPGFSDDEMLR